MCMHRYVNFFFLGQFNFLGFGVERASERKLSGEEL